jgi:thiamine biosynthesis lipoprotein
MDTRAKLLLGIGMLLLVGFSVYRLWLAPPPPRPYVDFGGASMGTTWSVKLASPDVDPANLQSISDAIQAELDEVVALMSTWEPDSEISRFNALRSTEPFHISPETVTVVQAALETSRLSNGAFDITVGPLVEAWGFGSRQRPDDPPNEAVLASLRESVGYTLLDLDPGSGTLRKRREGVEVDLSAIAKGYGVDRVASRLDALGYHDWLVEVGGELRTAGRKLDGSVWRVAIEQPDVAGRAIHLALPLEDRAMATSGDYRNFYEAEGVRLSHTMDPRTGRPITHGLASVTVIDTSTMRADALATALDVLGPEAGYALALERGLAVHLIIRTGDDGFMTRSTPAFDAFLEPAPRANDED